MNQTPESETSRDRRELQDLETPGTASTVVGGKTAEDLKDVIKQAADTRGSLRRS